MKILVNDQTIEIPEGTTLVAALKQLDLDRPGTAVAVNNRLVPAAERAEFVLTEGANVIVIGAVCGG